MALAVAIPFVQAQYDHELHIPEVGGAIALENKNKKITAWLVGWMA